MTQRKPLRKFLARLYRDQRGAVAVTFLLVSTIMIGGAFGAIDLVRHNVAQGRLQNSLDAAVISAGRNLANRTPTEGTTDETAWRSDAQQFFRSNMPDGFLGSTVSTDDLQIDYEEDKSEDGYRIGQYVDMSVTGDLPLISTGFLKITSFGLAASNQALRRTRSDLEVVMVLDNSGSMDFVDSWGGKTRMMLLKEAADNLIEMVFGAAEANENSRTFIGLVPFNPMINVGNTEHTRSWLTPDWRNSLFATNGNWTGCITEPLIGGTRPTSNIRASGAAPGNFRPLVGEFEDGRQVLGINNSRSSPRNINTSSRIVGGTQRMTMTRSQDLGYAGITMDVDPLNPERFIPELYRQSNQDRLRSRFQINAAFCSDPDVRRVMFMTNEKDELKDAIDDMVSEGGTSIPAGILWGWRMLHPDWQGRWGGPTVSLEDGATESLPRQPHRDLTKVMIILTDGENDLGASSTNLSTDNVRLRYDLNYKVNIVMTGSNYNNRSRCESRGHRWASSTCWNDNQDASLSVDQDFSVTKRYQRFTALYDGTASPPSEITDLNGYTRTLCSNVKSPEVNGFEGGIKVYTVAFGPASDTGLMADCASSNGFYNSSNVDDLNQAFESIAGDLMELRLTR